MDLAEQLKAKIVARQSDLVSLTQDLIRIPTLNPPGDKYLDICTYLDNRLRDAGFETQLIRAHGAVGDSDTHPRWNIVARKDGAMPGECVHFNSHIDVVEVGHGWTVAIHDVDLKVGNLDFLHFRKFHFHLHDVVLELISPNRLSRMGWFCLRCRFPYTIRLACSALAAQPAAWLVHRPFSFFAP